MTTRDYGVHRAPRQLALTIFGLAMIALAAAALFVATAVDQSGRMSAARKWTASGPSCAHATAASLLTAGEAPDQRSVFEGVRFGRTHGAVRCTSIGYNGGRSGDEFPVCEFDHPGGLEITTSLGRYDFLLEPMKAATVQIRRGLPSCVVGSTVEIH